MFLILICRLLFIGTPPRNKLLGGQSVGPQHPIHGPGKQFLNHAQTGSAKAPHCMKCSFSQWSQ
jgi:hypothetical protein